MKENSKILYTIENKTGEAETVSELSNENVGLLNIEILNDKIDIVFDHNDKRELFSTPLIKGFDNPYDWAITENDETIHYIYYCERKKE